MHNGTIVYENVIGSMPYTLSGTTALSPSDAEALVRESLAAEGFGILSEIGVQATLRAKLVEEIEPYRILGACSPRDAHRALGLAPELGALLPCNLIIHVSDGMKHLAAVDPVVMLGVGGESAFEPVWSAQVQA